MYINFEKVAWFWFKIDVIFSHALSMQSEVVQ